MADNVLKKHVVLTAQAHEFIFAQPLTVAQKFLKLIQDLEMSGQLTPPDAKKVAEDLFEMRIRDDSRQ